MGKFIVEGLGAEFVSELCRQAGIDPAYVRRVVLDFKFGSPARMYVELLADAEALDVAFAAGVRVVSDEAS